MADDSSTARQRALRDAMGSFATGVTIVTTRGTSGEDVGRTANSFSSVSLDPPMILWSLARSSSGLADFVAADHFAVHVLGAQQDALSARFAGKSPDCFAGLGLERGEGGIPLLRDCAARFECRTVYRYDGGDHVIFVGEVIGFRRSAAAPLLFHGGRYGRLVRQAGASPEPSGRPDSLGAGNLAWLLSRSFHELRAASAEIRASLDVDDKGYALLTLLGRNGRLPRDVALSLASQRGPEVLPEDCAELARRGLVSVMDGDRDPVVELTKAGRDIMLQVVAVIRSTEEDMLARLPDEDDGRILLDLLGALATRDSRGWPPVRVGADK